MVNKNNLPVFAISPKHTTLDFADHWALEDKIEVFIARIEGWQIGVAKEIIQKGITHRGFALLHIILSYFEMLGKYLDGFIKERKSRFYFTKGVKATFPEIGEEEEAFLDALYENVRNGLYHVGMTKINVMLRDDIPGSIGFNPERKILVISPDRLVEDLDIRFHEYATQLRNPRKNLDIRRKFEARFDYDNSELSL